MTVATVWTANTAKSLGNIVCPTNGVDGMFFRVTTAGTTGAGEPSWTKIIGQSVYDGTVVYEAFSSIFDDISKINPGSVILSGVMMLEFLGWQEAADLITKGLSQSISDQQVTYDLARLMEPSVEPLSCSGFANAVIQRF